MAKVFPCIEAEHRDFLLRQKLFFVASATSEGRVNLSPKGLDGLRVIDDRTVAYLDLTGSGNETAAHLRLDGRLTLMACAFDGAPLILRLYGRGRVAKRGDHEYARLLADNFGGVEPVGARQIIVLEVDRVQTSCGYGVPLYEYQGDRPTLVKWAEKKGEEGLEAYRREKNVESIDGFPTGLFDEPGAVGQESDGAMLRPEGDEL
jgi:hypothetical protein